MNPRPYVLLAELTYRCPLHCPYCSNPVRSPRGEELTAAEWRRVFAEAAQLGVLHLGLSGGEPLQRADLAEIVAGARDAGLYTNLITSAIGLDGKRARDLRAAGLDSIQVSFQSDESGLADEIAGAQAHERKLAAARIVREAGFPLSLNVVLHRRNIDRLAEIIALAEKLGAIRLELANVQYYGWAHLNQRGLLPSRAQVQASAALAREAQARLAGRMELVYVLPDFYETRPKPCMQGWGRRYLTVTPVGDVLPCPNATSIPDLVFENIRARPLAFAWRESASFNRFRGTGWMPSPCRECPQREIDFGGCRCQAALIAGDAAATDPVCEFSPRRALVDQIIASPELVGEVSGWTPRNHPATSEI